MPRFSPIPPPRWRGALALLLAVLPFLGGCPGPVRPGGSADEAVRQGQYEEAARGYELLAARASGAERDGYYLDAARAWLEAGLIARALSTLNRVRTPLPEDDPAVSLLQAYRALRDGAPEQALGRLEPASDSLPERYKPLWYELRGRAYLSTSQTSQGVGAFVEREFYLADDSARQANRELLWRELGKAAGEGAPLTPLPEASAITSGWLSLAQAVQSGRTDPFSAGQAIRNWQAGHEEHPGQYIALRLLASVPDLSDYPANVAVLLPFGGGLAGSANAIRDGLMAAWLADADNPTRPKLRFYDTEGGAGDAFASALADGAEFVVGPLRKSAVREAAFMPSDVSVLALNYLAEGDSPRANFFQFSLAPEHEAAAAARRALDEGLQTAVALVPDSPWGERVLSAFRDALELNGGILLGERGYDVNTRDFAAPITELLNLNESQERFRQVSAVTGLRMEFEPRRRQDVDFVFVAANPRQGRQIRPAFRFHFAEDLPVFATSSIYEDDPERNGRDVDGVVFADMPWIVAPDERARAAQIAFSRYWPARVKLGGRLYALGHDAYRLIPQLLGGDSPLALPWPGATGQLSLGAGGRIVRELEVAQIRNGLAIHLPPLVESPPADTELPALFGAPEENAEP